jgi:two-component system NtrC family sensor kinase
MIWFFLFSIVPLVLVTMYSIKQFQKAIDNELGQRLWSNGREVELILNDFELALKSHREKYIKEASLVDHFSNNNTEAINNLGLTWIQKDLATKINFYNKQGELIVSAFRNTKNEPHSLVLSQTNIFLSNQNLSILSQKDETAFVESVEGKKISLISILKLTASGKTLGYLEQIIDLDFYFLKKLKERMQLELILLKTSGEVVAGSLSDFILYNKDPFFENMNRSKKTLFDLTIRGQLFGFVTYPLSWGDSKFSLALGGSKKDSLSILKNVNYAFLTVVGAITVLLIFTIFIASHFSIKPLQELVTAIQAFKDSEVAIEIPIKSDTEIGLLTSSFNEMSRKIMSARYDLKKKLFELERANTEIREAQTQLVQAAKMASLGQLVAGVAHELNNPIGFIYSNMVHLKDYSEKLIKLIDIAENNPTELKKTKEEYELEYIKTDLPKLVASCEDGARRTKDIVQGLKNFSRLQEADLKEINIEEAIDNTLNLLTGEIKNRIEINKSYESVPLITCFASQINQVFMNLLSNSVQAISGEGKIWIVTKTIKNRKGVATNVSISIQDTGVGISAQNLEKIFDPFFTTKGVGQGTGLGLSISYGIIQNHGGNIFVKSQVGVGTEFTIKLPLKT